MKALWEDCTILNKGYSICAKVKKVAALLEQNYADSLNVYNTNKQKWEKRVELHATAGDHDWNR